MYMYRPPSAKHWCSPSDEHQSLPRTDKKKIKKTCLLVYDGDGLNHHLTIRCQQVFTVQKENEYIVDPKVQSIRMGAKLRINDYRSTGERGGARRGGRRRVCFVGWCFSHFTPLGWILRWFFRYIL